MRNQRIGTRRRLYGSACIDRSAQDGRAAGKHTSLPVPERLAHLEMELLSLELLLVHLPVQSAGAVGCCGDAPAAADTNASEAMMAVRTIQESQH